MKLNVIIVFTLLKFVLTVTSNSCLNQMKWGEDYICAAGNIVQNCVIRNEIFWNITNVELGIVEVQFNPCNEPYFYINLEYQDAAENQCKPEGVWKKHSEYSYTRSYDKNDGPKCPENAVIHLKYIFSGCYKIEIKSLKLLDLKYLQTNYIKSSIRNQEMKGECQQRPADNKTYFITKFKYPQHPEKIEICYHLQNEDSPRLLWIISCPVENSENICKITSQKHPINCTLKLIEKNYLNIECQIFGLHPGNYTLDRFILNEPIRCSIENTIWGNYDCHWTENIILPENEIIQDAQKPKEITSNYLKLISVLTIISVLIVLVYLLYKKIKTCTSGGNHQIIVYDPEASDNSQEDEEPPGILLLYAIDAEIFMETMTHFRRILQLSGYEVFDPYDINQQAKILTESPNTWLLRKIMDTNIKIILVLSKCGNYQIETGNKYKNQNCLDLLYKYGVGIFLEHSSEFPCNKLFVAKFSFFPETRFTTILSPERRFDLDVVDNFKLLIRCLLNLELDEIEGGTRRYFLFDEKCGMLREHVTNNCNYLEDVLDNV